jgi:hypothetical protein
MPAPSIRDGWRAAAVAALAAALSAIPGGAGGALTDTASDVAVKAALLYSFAKFTVWPALAPSAPIVACIAGNDDVAAEFTQVVTGHNAGGHVFDLRPAHDSATWPICNLLFVADDQIRRGSTGLAALKRLPILTVSDSRGFATSGGVIELYLEAGRMRFAINIDAADGAGLHLSSRLLGLAKIVRNADGQ